MGTERLDDGQENRFAIEPWLNSPRQINESIASLVWRLGTPPAKSIQQLVRQFRKSCTQYASDGGILPDSISLDEWAVTPNGELVYVGVRNERSGSHPAPQGQSIDALVDQFTQKLREPRPAITRRRDPSGVFRIGGTGRFDRHSSTQSQSPTEQAVAGKQSTSPQTPRREEIAELLTASLLERFGADWMSGVSEPEQTQKRRSDRVRLVRANQDQRFNWNLALSTAATAAIVVLIAAAFAVSKSRATKDSASKLPDNITTNLVSRSDSHSLLNMPGAQQRPFGSNHGPILKSASSSYKPTDFWTLVRQQSQSIQDDGVEPREIIQASRVAENSDGQAIDSPAPLKAKPYRLSVATQQNHVTWVIEDEIADQFTRLNLDLEASDSIQVKWHRPFNPMRPSDGQAIAILTANDIPSCEVRATMTVGYSNGIDIQIQYSARLSSQMDWFDFSTAHLTHATEVLNQSRDHWNSEKNQFERRFAQAGLSEQKKMKSLRARIRAERERIEHLQNGLQKLGQLLDRVESGTQLHFQLSVQYPDQRQFIAETVRQNDSK